MISARALARGNIRQWRRRFRPGEGESKSVDRGNSVNDKIDQLFNRDMSQSARENDFIFVAIAFAAAW